MRDQQIGIRAHWGTRLQPQLLKSNGALRNAPRVFHNNDIARHQIRRGKARKLVVGKVPGLDAEEYPDRAAFDLGFARTRIEVFGCEEAFGVLGVVVDNVRAEHHFAACLADELTHLQGHRASELVDARAHDTGRFRNYGRSLRKSRVPPDLEASRSGFKRRLELPVTELFEGLQDLAVVWINALVCLL